MTEIITTQDIRNAYAQIHGLTLANLKEFERLGLLTADQYNAEDLSLPINEFMVKAGFIQHVMEKTDKRPYNKRVK